jgi:hypothetical protein
LKKESRPAKPLFDFESDVSVRRSYSISDKAADLVEAYADFHTDLARSAGGAPSKRISAGDVVEKLILSVLAKDKAFAEWRREKRRGGEANAAIRAGKVNVEAVAAAAMPAPATVAPKPTLKAAAAPQPQAAK